MVYLHQKARVTFHVPAAIPEECVQTGRAILFDPWKGHADAALHLDSQKTVKNLNRWDIRQLPFVEKLGIVASVPRFPIDG